MTHASSFGLLKTLSVVFKVLAFVVLALMLIGMVGTLMASKSQGLPVLMPVVLNMVFSGILAFLMLFTFGEVLRILLAIESNTHKE